MKTFDILIVGGGVVGTSLSYFLSCLNGSKSIGLVEQAAGVARHASKRNTGKVHAPHLYDPQKKRLFAKTAFHGYRMWSQYAELKKLPFKKDGVIEVALDGNDAKILDRHLKWAAQNGLDDSEIQLLGGKEVQKLEPNVRCESALHVRRDAAVDYAAFTESLCRDSQANGVAFLFGSKVTDIQKNPAGCKITLDNKQELVTKFLINAAGGQAVDIAHDMGFARGLTDVHFRGEYWNAPAEYHDLTRASIYCVPSFPKYPFLDPHWIVRADGSCQIGPNAVPVFGPYGYDAAKNLKEFLPKILEMASSGAKKTILDAEFQRLAVHEMRSSLSKSSMVKRVARFLPGLDPGKITSKGTAGIRSSVINKDGGFESDIILLDDQTSFHILNYNSPGATGALPFSVHVIDRLCKTGLFKLQSTQCGPWDYADIVERLG